MTTVQELLDREAIRRLPIDYATAVHDRDVEAMSALFSPDASFGEHGRGPDGLRSLMGQSLQDSLVAVILVANHRIDLDGDRATGSVWAQCFAENVDGGFIEQLLRYDDRYERVDGQWLFRHRRHRLWYGLRREPSPLLQAPAEWPQSQVGTGDVPLSDPVFRAWWEARR